MTPEHRTLIDQALQTNAQQEKIRAERSGISIAEIPDLEILRQSWLGQRLEQLAEVAEQGLLYIGKLQARALLEETSELLFTGVCDRNEPVSQMLDQARARVLDTQDVVNITEASRTSKLSRTLIYLMIKGGLLHPIEMNGRTMIERQELDRLEELKEKEKDPKSS